MSRKSPLPIDDPLPEIVAAVHRSSSVVLEAAPGAGKTTRVPAALLSHIAGEILVLEPRRIAARMAARRVAEELGEKPGETVGYTVRFEQVGGESTRLRFLTEGVLTRRLQADHTLRGVGMVILDEFHERHLDTDLAIALLHRLQHTTRPDLKLLVMSATMNAAPVAAFLDGCPILRSEGRSFPLTIEHIRYSPLPIETQVSNALTSVITRSSGHTLIFLPGAAEIRRSIAACSDLARRFDLELLPLHGDLPSADQDRAVAASSRRKVIFATNVAESSITIDGVSTVIDSGLARIATTSPWTGLPTLEIGRVSQASLRQRAGRAGRTGPGLALRLFPEEDLQRRPAHDMPEILRADLSQLVLTLRVLDIADEDAIAWLASPPRAALDAAASLLHRLGAVGERARELARYPLPPRLARVLTEAKVRGATHSACVAVALLSMRLATGNLLEAADQPPMDHRFRQQLNQLLRLTQAPRAPEHNDAALQQALLAGFPDRVARLRSDRQLLLGAGVSAELAGQPPQQEFLLALDAEDRKEKPLPLVRTYAPIEAEWLLDLFPENIRETQELVWNRAAERVEEVSGLVYDQLVLSESRHAPTNMEAAAEMLADTALAAGIARFIDTELLDNLLARLVFSGAPEPDVAAALRELCTGLRSFTELKSAATSGLLPLVEQRAGVRLHELAPATLRLQAGRITKIHYERGKPPWIASRLQDFFGMRETPRIGPAKTPVVLHLLAPNQRAVQTTSDLAGFWERLYPSVRRELMRRYPRHSWPELPY